MLNEPARLGTTYRSLLLPRLGVPMSTNGVALDVGGRTGAWLRQCQSSLRTIIDLEVQPGSSVSGVAGSGLALPLRDDQVDLLYALDVIEHVPDDQQFLRELSRTLRPGGALTLTTPDHRIAVFPGFLQPWVDRRWGHDRVRGYEAEHLRDMLTDAGFCDVRVRNIAMRAYRWFYLPLRLIWTVSPPVGSRAVAACATLDARSADGQRGFLLVSASKGE